MLSELYIDIHNVALEYARNPLVPTMVRSILTVMFWGTGVMEIGDFDAFAAEMRLASLPFPRLSAVMAISIKIIGSILVIGNFDGWGWIAAAALAIFTLLTVPYGHAFWKFAGPRRIAEIHIALEHVALAGGMILAMVMLLH
jgi:transmembrane protein